MSDAPVRWPEKFSKKKPEKFSKKKPEYATTAMNPRMAEIVDAMDYYAIDINCLPFHTLYDWYTENKVEERTKKSQEIAGWVNNSLRYTLPIVVDYPGKLWIDLRRDQNMIMTWLANEKDVLHGKGTTNMPTYKPKDNLSPDYVICPMVYRMVRIVQEMDNYSETSSFHNIYQKFIAHPSMDLSRVNKTLTDILPKLIGYKYAKSVTLDMDMKMIVDWLVMEYKVKWGKDPMELQVVEHADPTVELFLRRKFDKNTTNLLKKMHNLKNMDNLIHLREEEINDYTDVSNEDKEKLRQITDQLRTVEEFLKRRFNKDTTTILMTRHDIERLDDLKQLGEWQINYFKDVSEEDKQKLRHITDNLRKEDMTEEITKLIPPKKLKKLFKQFLPESKIQDIGQRNELISDIITEFIVPKKTHFTNGIRHGITSSDIQSYKEVLMDMISVYREKHHLLTDKLRKEEMTEEIKKLIPPKKLQQFFEQFLSESKLQDIWLRKKLVGDIIAEFIVPKKHEITPSDIQEYKDVLTDMISLFVRNTRTKLRNASKEHGNITLYFAPDCYTVHM